MPKLSTKAEIAEAGAKARLALRLLLAIVEAERQVELDSNSMPGHEKDPPPYPTVKDRDALASIRRMDKAIKAGRAALAISWGSVMPRRCVECGKKLSWWRRLWGIICGDCWDEQDEL